MTAKQTVNAPGNTPAIGDEYFQRAWNNFLADMAAAVNASLSADSGVVTTSLQIQGTLTVTTGNATTVDTLTSGATTVSSLTITGDVGFFGTAPAAKPNVLGGWGPYSVGKHLCIALADLGLITDSTTSTAA